MKKAKKLASLLLALIMALALTVPAMAAGETTGTITLDNPQEGQDYTAYKIFDVKYNTDKSAYSYTIDSGSAWFTTVQTYAADAAHGLTLTQVNDTTTYNVSTTDAFSAAAFADTLKANTTGKTGTPLTVAEGKATATGLELGYYFVSSTSGALCNLTTTNPSVTIHDKNDVPFDKVDDKDSVEVGEKVSYTITGKVPDTTGFTACTYKITDTMSEGLTFNKDVVVKIGDADVTAECTVTYTPADGTATGFELTIPVKDYQTQIGAAITVTYTATVNENAVAVVSNNEAKLTYSNNPTNTETGTISLEPVTVYSAKIVIDKYAANPDNAEDTSGAKLADAKFILYKEEPAGTKMYYKYTPATTDPAAAAKVEWVADKTQATEVTTDNNGAADFKGLKDGTYYLLETVAPAGYNLLAEPVTITIKGTGDDNKTPVEANLTHTEKVANNTGAMLPSTGGIGTTIFYVLGGLLAVGAAVLLVTKKRMSAEK